MLPDNCPAGPVSAVGAGVGLTLSLVGADGGPVVVLGGSALGAGELSTMSSFETGAVVGSTIACVREATAGGRSVMRETSNLDKTSAHVYVYHSWNYYITGKHGPSHLQNPPARPLLPSRMEIPPSFRLERNRTRPPHIDHTSAGDGVGSGVGSGVGEGVGGGVG